MDYPTYLWFLYLDAKLDLILAGIDTADEKEKILALKAHVDQKAAELKAVVEASAANP